ncbi:MAG TPA: hypothetical protein VFO11_03945 [Candidatus Polarisedimenticolaceae bacterium]|nr:hypothetical protein [Candidatus Polarisedimenticolaceae bacterium]
MRRSWLAVLVLASLTACAGPAPQGSAATYVSKELGFAFKLPEGWKMYGEEAKSKGGTLINWQVKSLEGAEPGWLEGLPESVVPELGRWTSHFFGDIQEEQKETGTVGGEPALIVTHTVHEPKLTTRKQVRYWVVRHGQVLYLIRAVYPAEREPEEDPGARALLATWRFTPPTGTLPS